MTGNSRFSLKKIQSIFGTHFTPGNGVKLLWKDRESFQGIFDAVENATRFVCLEFYIFRNDETGIELADILCRKASEGVDIYLLYDHFGSIGTTMKFWGHLKNAGIRIRASHPFKWLTPFHYVHRDHRKLIIIDGKIAFTGGLNIANEYRGYHRARKSKGWRDTGILLEGPIAKTLFEGFKEAWTTWGGDPISHDLSTDYIAEGLPVLPIFASSAKGRRRMRKLLYYSITQAQKSILLTTAYFTPSRRMLQVLEDAVKRGVDVRLLLPGPTDFIAAYYAGRAFFTRLLRAGVRIYNYRGEILHAKTAVFDGVWSIIGSANLDFQSLRKNDEGNVGIVSEEFGRQMSDIFDEDIKHSGQIQLEEWLKRSYVEKIEEHLFALLRRRL